MIVTMFPEPREQAKAIGVYGFVASAGGSIGLLAGGALTEAINWHWIFFINLPDRRRHRARSRCASSTPGRASGCGPGADLPGAVLLTGGLMLGVYTILGVGEAGLERRPGRSCSAPSRSRCSPRSSRARRGSPTRSCRCGCSARATSPGANLVQALLVVGMFGMFFLGALYLQQILGYDPLEVGLAFLPVDDRHGRDVAALLRAR